MDAIQEFMASGQGGGLKIDDFVISGASKRGWTTWLVGIVDKRVIGMMPLVIDALNTEAVTRHHYEAYGFFSPSLGDYVRHGGCLLSVEEVEENRIIQLRIAQESRKTG